MQVWIRKGRDFTHVWWTFAEIVIIVIIISLYLSKHASLSSVFM